MDGTGAEVRASDRRSWRIKRLDDHTRRDRTVLHAYVMIGAFSGLRPTEMYNLTWGDVLGYRRRQEEEGGRSGHPAAGAGQGQERQGHPAEGGDPLFDTLWMLFERSMGREPADSDPVFASEIGKRITSVANGIHGIGEGGWARAGSQGIKRTRTRCATSTSASNCERAEVLDVARNCRTSLAMIDKHYGQVRLERVVDRLRPEWTRA